MPDPDLSNIPDGPPIFPSDRNVNSSDRTLNEIKRLLYWTYHEQVKRRDELAFVTFHKSDVTNSGGTINLHIKNPSDSGITLDVRSISVTSQFLGEYTIHDEFSSAPSGGSASNIDNILMDTSGGPADVGDATANNNVSFTSSGTHFAETIPSGGASGNPMGGETQATQPLIEPGREIVVELQNDSSTTRPGSIGVSWIEEPYVYSTQ